jgi:DNA repair protein RadD
MIELRPQQNIAMQSIRDAYAQGFKAPLLVAPCGFGKTVVFSAMAESAERRRKRVLILCHRVELVDQIVATLKDFGVQPDIIAAGFRRGSGRSRAGNRSIAVASVQTLVRRLDQYPAPTLITVDECHHAVSAQWSTVIRKFPEAKLLGVTASPIRGDSRGLGAMFDKLILGPTVTELTDSGLLARARIFAPPTVDTSGLHMRAGEYKTEESEALMDKPAITGDAFSHYEQHAKGKPALAFCTSVAHSHHVAEHLRRKDVAAVALDGSTDRQIRRMAVDDFRRGAIRVLAQCDLANEGFDIPGVHCGIFLRPTASLGLWIQQMGRCMRIAPGKREAIFLDHVGNTTRLGLPTDERDWQLSADTVRAKKKTPGVRVCLKCFAASPAYAKACGECGAVFPVKAREELEQRDGTLVEITPEELARKRERREQGMAQTREQLLAVARIKGWNPRRVDYILAGRERKKLNKETA